MTMRSIVPLALAGSVLAPVATPQPVLPDASQEFTFPDMSPYSNPPPPGSPIGRTAAAQCTPDTVPDVVYHHGSGVWMLYSPHRHGAMPVEVHTPATDFAVLPNATADGNDGLLVATASSRGLFLWNDVTKEFDEHLPGGLAGGAKQIEAHPTPGGLVTFVVSLSTDGGTITPALYMNASGGTPAHVLSTSFTPITLASTANSFVLADLDADGTPEIGVEHTSGVFEVLNLSDGSSRYSIPGALPGGAATTLDDADTPNLQYIARIAHVPPMGIPVAYVLGASGGIQTSVIDLWGGTILGLAAADHDLDGDADLCFTLQDAPSAGRLENVQATPSAAPDFSGSTISLAAGSSPGGGAWPVFADIDQDGKPGDPDVVVFDSAVLAVYVLENQEVVATDFRVEVLSFAGDFGAGSDPEIELELLPPTASLAGTVELEYLVWALPDLDDFLASEFLGVDRVPLPSGPGSFLLPFAPDPILTPPGTEAFAVMLCAVEVDGSDEVVWRYPTLSGMFSLEDATFDELIVLAAPPPEGIEHNTEPPGGGWVPGGDVGPFPIRP